MQEVREETINEAIATAQKRWKNKDRPDRLDTKVTVNSGSETTTLHVVIAHKETFPQGDQAFRVVVRHAPGPGGEPGELVRRDTFSLLSVL